MSVPIGYYNIENVSPRSVIIQDILYLFQANSWNAWTCIVSKVPEMSPIWMDERKRRVILCPLFVDNNDYEILKAVVKQYLNRFLWIYEKKEDVKYKLAMEGKTDWNAGAKVMLNVSSRKPFKDRYKVFTPEELAQYEHGRIVHDLYDLTEDNPFFEMEDSQVLEIGDATIVDMESSTIPRFERDWKRFSIPFLNRSIDSENCISAFMGCEM